MVTYTTTGVFASSGTSTSNAGIVYAPQVATTINAPSNSPLGFLSASSVAPNIGDTLTITIWQTLPGSGNDTVVGTLSGMIAFASSTGDLVFTSSTIASIVAGGFDVTYNPQNETFINPTTGVPVPIEARINATIVPLPAAAWGGMALFGVLGGAKLRRSRQSVMA
jgi:hypothetical protein